MRSSERNSKAIGIAFIGCGFVADYYLECLAHHHNIELLGVADRNNERARRFANYYKTKAYATPDEVLRDDRFVQIPNYFIRQCQINMRTDTTLRF